MEIKQIIKQSDFNLICRLCLNREPKLKPIFIKIDTSNVDNNFTTIQQMIVTCLGLNMNPDDGLPISICNKCTQKLIDSHTFHVQCSSADKHLRNIILQNDSNDNSHLYAKRRKNQTSCTPSFPSNYDVKSENFDDLNLNDYQLNSTYENNLNSDSDNSDELVKSNNTTTINRLTNKKMIQKPNTEASSSIIPKVISEDCSTKPKSKRLSRSKEAIAERAKQKATIKPMKKNERKALQRKQNEGICPICGKFTKAIYAHVRAHGNSRYVECEYCNKIFHDKNYLKRHFKIHFNIKQYQCTLCPYKFITPTNLNLHMRTHTGEKPFKCKICSKAFGTTSTRKDHEKTHLQDRNVSCPYCDKLFLTKKYLKSHIGIHTGERPFKCDLCDSSFIASSALTVHRQRVHKNQSNLNQCNVCWITFKDRPMLRHHLREHGINDLKVGGLEIINAQIEK